MLIGWIEASPIICACLHGLVPLAVGFDILEVGNVLPLEEGLAALFCPVMEFDMGTGSLPHPKEVPMELAPPPQLRPECEELAIVCFSLQILYFDEITIYEI